MKRFLCLWLCVAACLLPVYFASAAGPAEPLEGRILYPEGASEQEATFLFEYSYPQFEPESKALGAVNEYYQAVCGDMSGVLVPQSVRELAVVREEGMPPFSLQIGYDVTARTDEYLSVLLTARQFLGIAESETVTGNVFALDGVYEGQPVTLSQVMGLEQDDDELSEKNSYAAQLVYKLVWQIITEQRVTMQTDYFEDVSRSDMEAAFSPETDFYLDANGNLVFYLQPGTVAGDVAGVLTFPFSIAELLSTVKDAN